MKNLSDNNKIFFKNISKEKDGLVAKFKVKALRNSIYLEATISVNIEEMKDPLEDIISKCASEIQREMRNMVFEVDAIESTECSAAW